MAEPSCSRSGPADATSIPDKIIGNRPRWQKVAATIVADSRKASLGAMPIPMPIAKGSPSGQ